MSFPVNLRDTLPEFEGLGTFERQILFKLVHFIFSATVHLGYFPHCLE